MNNLLRQISDIISQAEQINIENSKTKLKAFSKFNDEMKSYLLENIENENIVEIISGIPSLQKEVKPNKSFTSFVIGTITNGGSNFLQTAEESEETMIKIGIIKSKYSSIEMLLKNSRY